MAEQREREALLTLLRLDVINFSFARPKEPVKFDDLMPDLKASKPGPAKRKRMTTKRRQAVAEQIRRFIAPHDALVVNQAE